MEQWGLTGLMGSGKSLARAYLESRGFPAIDADDVARKMLSTDFPENLIKLKKMFGAEVLKKDGTVNRGFIRKIITSDTDKRRQFEGWLHPAIRMYNRDLARQWENAGYPVAFFEGTRLVESGAWKELSGIILVTAPPDLRRQRLGLRAEMSPEEQEKLTRTQDESLMRQHSQIIWDNSGAPKDLYRLIDQFLRERGFTKAG